MRLLGDVNTLPHLLCGRDYKCLPCRASYTHRSTHHIASDNPTVDYYWHTPIAKSSPYQLKFWLLVLFHQDNVEEICLSSYGAGYDRIWRYVNESERKGRYRWPDFNQAEFLPNDVRQRVIATQAPYN